MSLQLLSAVYNYFARYYESGQRGLGQASEEEKMWSALVVYSLLDTLSTKHPHEKLERSCVACLQAVVCSIVPDTLLPVQDHLSTMYRSSSAGYDPQPASISRVAVLKPEVKQFVQDYARFSHDTWVFEQVNNYTYTEQTFFNEVVSNLLLWSDVFTFVENLFFLGFGGIDMCMHTSFYKWWVSSRGSCARPSP